MPVRSYKQGILYHLNFIPWLIIMTLFLAMVYVLPSSNKQPGYVFICALSIFCCFLWLREKRKVAQNVSINEETIVASGFFTKETSITWGNIESLIFSGRGLFFVAGKIQKFLYAEIISKNHQKIVIRRDIQGFTELTELIENKAENSSVPTLNSQSAVKARYL